MPVARELPPPSPELVIIAELTAVYLRRLPRKERLAFLVEVSDGIRRQAELAAVLRIRPAASDKEVAEAREKAAAWWAAVAEKLAECAR